MNIVVKFEIPSATSFALPLRIGSRVMKIGIVNGKAYMWVMEDESATQVKTKFLVVIDGQEPVVPINYVYVDSYILCNGAFVGHVFMEQKFA